MHNVQKKAVLAIISMIESGLREIRSVLTDASVASGPDLVAYAPRHPEPVYGSPLEEHEERSLEMIMEQNRQEMLKSAASMFQNAPPSDFFEGDE